MEKVRNMEWSVERTRKRLFLISAIILLVGLGSAALIYLKAPGELTGVLGYESEGGSEYPIMPDDSKQYMRGLQLYGGTANVLADELRLWFDGLWHGKSLAYTVAVMTIFVSVVIIFVANHLPPGRESEGRGSGNPGESG